MHQNRLIRFGDMTKNVKYDHILSENRTFVFIGMLIHHLTKKKIILTYLP